MRSDKRFGRPLPFWVGRHSQFRPALVTTLQTWVSSVNIGHKGSRVAPVLAWSVSALSAGFPPLEVPLRDAGCLPFTPLLTGGSQGATSSIVKGRTPETKVFSITDISALWLRNSFSAFVKFSTKLLVFRVFVNSEYIIERRYE